MIIFNIITPCTRPENLDKIKKSIGLAIQNTIEISFSVAWYVIFDSNKVFPSRKLIESLVDDKFRLIPLSITGISRVGNLQRNYALDIIKEGWVLFHDDDNIIHPNLLKIIIPKIKENPEIRAITFNSEIRTGDNVKRCHIDTAQFIVNYELIGGLRWELERYDADGVFIQTIYQAHRDKFLYLNNILSYYNKLRQD